MAYPNEHTARLRDSKDFKPNSFRRTNGGSIGTVNIPRNISIIWGSEEGSSARMTPQAFRFPTKYWNAERAKQWLEDNGYGEAEFEAAQKLTRKLSGDNDQSVGLSGTIFNLVDMPETEGKEAGSEGETPRRFQIHAYTGAEVSQKAGNKVVRAIVDLASLRFPTDPLPILREHDRKCVTGVADTHDVSEEGYFLTGEYLDTEDGIEVCSSLDQGFPWQASISVVSDNVEFVKQGSSVPVNNRTFEGPGYVMRDGFIREVSFCVFGADEHTSALALAEGDTTSVEVANTTSQKEQQMELEQMTLAALKEARPDLVESLVAEGRESASTEIEQIRLAAKDEGKTLGLSEGIAQEKDRILALCQPHLQFAKAPGISGEQLGVLFGALLTSACEGKTATEIELQLKDIRLKQLENASPESPGGNETTEEEDADKADANKEAQLTSLWDKADFRALRLQKANPSLSYEAALKQSLRELNTEQKGA